MSVIRTEAPDAAVIAYLRDSCPVPLPPPEREWIMIDPDLPDLDAEKQAPDAPQESCNVLSYNILCDRYATAQMYGYTPSWALTWDYRKEFILQEVMSYSADVCCLQEVDMEQYEDYFLHHLSQQDYEGVFYPKSRARTMRDSTGQDRSEMTRMVGTMTVPAMEARTRSRITGGKVFDARKTPLYAVFKDIRAYQ